MSLSRLAIELTTRCNLRCEHCLREVTDKPDDFPIELLDRVLDQAVSGYFSTCATGHGPVVSKGKA